MYGDRPTVSSVGTMSPYPSQVPPMHFQSGRQPSPHQYGRIGGGRVTVYSAPPSMSLNRSPMYYMRVRAKALCGLTAFFGFITFVSFWALYYWPIACALMLLYLSMMSYREAAGFGSMSSNWTFSRSGLFVGRELIFVVFGICFLLCLAEVVVGIILCIVEDDATRAIFCAVGAATGALSLVSLFMLNRSLKYLESPVATIHASLGPPQMVHGGPTHVSPPPAAYYYEGPYRQPQPVASYPPVVMQPIVDSFERRSSPYRRPPSPRRVQFEPTDEPTVYADPSVPPTQHSGGRHSPNSVIPPAGLAEMSATRAGGAPFASPPPRHPQQWPHQGGSVVSSPSASLYPERRY